MEATQMSIKGYSSLTINKGVCMQRNIIQPVKERSIDIYYNTHEPWKHSIKWEKHDSKGHTLCDSIYIKYPK